MEIDNRRIKIPKVGWVGFHKSREIEGVVKNATISYKAGNWFASLQTEQEVADKVHVKTDAVGLDMGVKFFASLSSGIQYEPLNSFRRLESKLAKAQKLLSRKNKFSANWRKQKLKIARIHHKIANARGAEKEGLAPFGRRCCALQRLQSNLAI